MLLYESSALLALVDVCRADTSPSSAADWVTENDKESAPNRAKTILFDCALAQSGKCEHEVLFC